MWKRTITKQDGSREGKKKSGLKENVGWYMMAVQDSAIISSISTCKNIDWVATFGLLNFQTSEFVINHKYN